MKVDDYKFYAQAGAELESGEMDKGVWARAFSETSDNEGTSRLYIKYRVAQLGDTRTRVRLAMSKASAELESGQINQLAWEKAQRSSTDPELVRRDYLSDRTAFWSKVLALDAKMTPSVEGPPLVKEGVKKPVEKNKGLSEPYDKHSNNKSDRTTHTQQSMALDEAGSVNPNGPNLGTSEKDPLSSTKGEATENKNRDWLALVVNIILVTPPARLFGAWIFYLRQGGSFEKWEVLAPSLDNGLTWFTVLWPFALVYWIANRNKNISILKVSVLKICGHFKKRFNEADFQAVDFAPIIIIFVISLFAVALVV